MDINVTIHSTTQGISSGFILCNIISPSTYQQFSTLGFGNGAYDRNNAGELLATQRIVPPVSTDTVMSFTGLAPIPYCFIEFMVSADGSRQAGTLYNVDGFNFEAAISISLIHTPRNPNSGSPFIGYTITF